jgi:hypothetical protein
VPRNVWPKKQNQNMPHNLTLTPAQYMPDQHNSNISEGTVYAATDAYWSQERLYVVSRGSWRLTGHPLHSPLDHMQTFLHVCFVFP